MMRVPLTGIFNQDDMVAAHGIRLWFTMTMIESDQHVRVAAQNAARGHTIASQTRQSMQICLISSLRIVV